MKVPRLAHLGQAHNPRTPPRRAEYEVRNAELSAAFDVVHFPSPCSRSLPGQLFGQAGSEEMVDAVELIRGKLSPGLPARRVQAASHGARKKVLEKKSAVLVQSRVLLHRPSIGGGGA